LQQVRLLIWGESLGLVPRENGKSCYNAAVDRPDIRPAIESALHHLRNLLAKADVITGRYETQEGPQPQSSTLLQNESMGMIIFRSKFDKFKARLRQSQKDMPTWKVTRWSVHDYDKFRELITAIKDLLDSLESITTALGLLQQLLEAALVEEIESLSDTKSLRLLHTVASTSSASAALKAISDTASYRISLIESSTDGRSFHTAHTHPATMPSIGHSVASTPNAYDAALAVGVDSRNKSKETAAQAPPQISPTDVPQHQRWMASLAYRRDSRPREHTFTSEDLSYGSQLKAIREVDEEAWRERSARLIQEADKGSSLAQRAFVELRSIRRARIPFISVSPMRDRLDCLLASIEGPPGTPYEGGVFWITVKLIPYKPPALRFQTRIYHPNIDCTGKLCASFEEWWTDENLRKYMRTLIDMNAPWFSENRSNTFSLGAILVALCSLLASPNVDNPLVPEIAETYITNYDGYVRAARLYTMKYALDTNAPLDPVFDNDGDDAGAVGPYSVLYSRGGADPAASTGFAAAPSSVYSPSRPASFDNVSLNNVSLGIDIRQVESAAPSEQVMMGQAGRPLASPRKFAEIPKNPSSVVAAKIKGPYMCECCPKKPKKFNTEEELQYVSSAWICQVHITDINYRTHEAEKQYECSFCGNRFNNKNEAERHQNSLHVRRHSWSCSALTGYERAFHDSTTKPGKADTCGYCGDEFPRSGRNPAGAFITEQDWEERIRHLQDVHKFQECNSSKKFYRADHFRQHLKHGHAGTSGKWTNMLENACMMEEDPLLPAR